MSHLPYTSAPVPAPLGTFDTFSKIIYCQNSGVVLGTLSLKVQEGYLAYLEAHSESIYLHPLYRMSTHVLVKKLNDALTQAHEQAWVLIDAEKQRLRLLVSAMMHNLEAVKQEQPCLPSYEIAAGSAHRLLGIAKWYFYVSSQRLVFPTYSVSQKNQNLRWENYKHWLDAAYELRKDWATKSKEMKLEAELRAREESLREIKSLEVFKRVDTNKVWNWIHLQLDGNYAAGRLETFKRLFISGDLEAHEWLVDDVDDLREALLQHCDMGNEISFYINKRLNGIQELIRDFYSGFTLVGALKTEAESSATGELTKQEAEFIDEFDKQASQLEELPPEPQRSGFETMAKFIQAQAKWRILAKRWKLIQERKKNPPKADPDTIDL